MSRAVATLVLALVLEPLAQAAAAAAVRSAHSCCPKQEQRAPADTPCQFAAPLVCCAQSGVSTSSSKETPPPAQLSIRPDSFVAALALPARQRTVLGTESPPPIPPLLRTTVLQL